MMYHYAATTFVYRDGRFAIHWHEKVKKWLPPGGHIEENELPHEAAIREVEEELGIVAVLVAKKQKDYKIPSIPMPLAIIVEEIDEFHSHVDFIYVATAKIGQISEKFRFVTLFEAVVLNAPADVIELAKDGLELLKTEGFPQ
jgi:8-oxo-dGTP pyrophosphatase MutT (NUDIX family)